jgi:hypothetical protein
LIQSEPFAVLALAFKPAVPIILDAVGIIGAYGMKKSESDSVTLF